jgi:hypothetical protein
MMPIPHYPNDYIVNVLCTLSHSENHTARGEEILSSTEVDGEIPFWIVSFSVLQETRKYKKKEDNFG